MTQNTCTKGLVFVRGGSFFIDLNLFDNQEISVTTVLYSTVLQYWIHNKNNLLLKQGKFVSNI